MLSSYTGDFSFAGNVDIQGNTFGAAGPGAHGLVGWTFDPTMVNTGQTGTAQTIYLSGIFVARSASLTKLYWGINTAGATITASQNFVGLYNSSGTRLASVGVDARVTTTGLFTETISASVSPGMYWVAFVFNATTMPAVYRGPGQLNATLVNAGITTAASYRYATAGTGQTSLPSSITTTSNVASQNTYWAALA
jgi:hypothetical protein